MKNLAAIAGRAVVLSLCLWPLLGCDGSDDDSDHRTVVTPDTGGAESMFDVPEEPSSLSGSSWLNHPFPSDFRLGSDGSVPLSAYPNPKAIPLLKLYAQAMQGVIKGYSPVAAGYVRFSGAIDPSRLPQDPKESVDPRSSVQLIDVDPKSPEKGSRKLISLYWRASEGAYWPANTLAFMPTMGYPLRPNTQYAFVVTDDLTASRGYPLRASHTLRKVLGIETPDGPEKTLASSWAPALSQIASLGISAQRIMHLTVFTTGDPTAETIKVADHAKALAPVPHVIDKSWTRTTERSTYTVYEAKYGPSPDYQRGTPPFEAYGDGGGFEFDSSGAPIKQREFSPRFALAIPRQGNCPMPTDGYPIVLYAHGTGGDYRSFIDDGTARSLANMCLASMGVDQIMHAERLPKVEGKTWDPSILFFNFQNPEAARTNVRQSAVDETVRARLVREGHIEVPAEVSVTRTAIKIDPEKVLFYGHSQGGLNGPLFMAVSDGARGGVLSGSGAMISITLLKKTSPDPSVAGLVKTVLLGLNPDQYEELNALHPGISFMQTLVDVSDPIHYAPLLVQRPREGFSPKSIYQTEGVNPDFTGDTYTPPQAIETEAVAIGLPLMTPVIHPIPEMSYGGLGTVTIPEEGLSGNLAGGKASGVLAQWPASQASDGHFVVFDIPAAQEQAARFCKNLAADPVGRVPAP